MQKCKHFASDVTILRAKRYLRGEKSTEHCRQISPQHLEPGEHFTPDGVRAIQLAFCWMLVGIFLIVAAAIALTTFILIRA